MLRLQVKQIYRRLYSSSPEYDVVFIGAGPGGYVGAIKAAQLGLRTACVEKRPTLGGTCLNVGCIPSKALLHNSHLFYEAKEHFSDRGIDFDGLKVNLERMLAQKDRSVKTLTSGIEFLFRKNKISHLFGQAKITSPNTVQITKDDCDGKIETISAKNFVIATGSDIIRLPNVAIDEHKIVSSTGALSLSKVPNRLIVIGAGIIGLELGSVWCRLGSKVTFIEVAEQLGNASMDSAVSSAFTKILKKQGMSFLFKHKVVGVTESSNGKIVQVESLQGEKSEVEADVVLVCIGRKPYTEGLGLEDLGIEVDKKGRIVTSKNFSTNIPSIRAIGDVIAGPMLAHKAEEEGVAVAEILAGKTGHVNYNAIPNVIYTHPEVAWVGLTEEAAAKAVPKISTGLFSLSANSRARTVDDYDGFVKVITDADSDKLLGVHIIGPNAGELIGEATLALEYGASSEDVARTCHAHPTLSEAIKEACLAAHGLKKAINC